MAFGLTLQGFNPKTLQDAKGELEASFRAVFGNGINLQASSIFGQIIGIVSEREALIWQALLGIYNTMAPETAEGVNLDNVVSITGIKRLEATKGTGSGKAFGTLNTVIPAGSIVSVNGNSQARFVTVADATIGAGTNEVQDVDFSAVPDAGDWTLLFDGEETGVLAFNDNAAAVQAALNALPNLSGVTVAGNYAAGFTVTFAGADGQIDQPMLQVGSNNLTNTGAQVNMTIVETTPGVPPNVTVDLIAETAGEIPAYANTLTVIETPVAGWASFNNPTDIDPGTDIETDAELRLRRNKTLATAGAATVDAIRARILEIDEVDDARVFENDTDVVDGAGRPPHSFEAVVLGGDDQEIIDTIWDVKPAGIATDGSTSGTAVDSMGFSHTVKFSRPTAIPIVFIVNLTVDPALYPVDGDDAVKQAIVDYGIENFSIGDDVITVRFFCPIQDVQGILDIEILIDVDPAVPVSDANIAIADDEIADFDTARITVNS